MRIGRGTRGGKKEKRWKGGDERRRGVGEKRRGGRGDKNMWRGRGGEENRRRG